MRLKKTPVLDEREMQELYRIEHHGLWLMYALLCAAVLVQLLAGAPLAQMAGELAVIVIVSVVMIIANVRHGIWDQDSRPSARGNAVYSLGAGICVAAMLAVTRRNPAAALAAGALAGVLCFAVLMLLMRYMQRRQARREMDLENE